MNNGFSSPIFSERLQALYELKKIDTDTTANRGWSLIVAKEMFEMGIVEYAKTDSDGNEKTKPQQNNDLARQLKKHLEKENPPETIWIKRYCKYFNCSADYLLGFIHTPTYDTRAIKSRTGLSVAAGMEIMKMTPAERKLLDRFFTVQPGLLSIVRKMLNVASYIHQKGEIKIILPDGEARQEATKELENSLRQNDTREMLSFTLQKEIERMIDSVLDDEEMQEIAHKEMIAYYRKHSFTYSPKGLPLSAMDLPRLSKDGTHLVSVDSDE